MFQFCGHYLLQDVPVAMEVLVASSSIPDGEDAVVPAADLDAHNAEGAVVPDSRLNIPTEFTSSFPCDQQFIIGLTFVLYNN